MAPDRSHSSNSNSNSNSNIHRSGSQSSQTPTPTPFAPPQQPEDTSSSGNLFPKIPNILPHERVFPIQIGSELFKLSGASLSSDAPSYFSQYFLCQLQKAKENGTEPSASIRTLYIDRDPLTFRDISLHLQGYHVSPRDGTHFVRLFADAQFYSLPRLISQLYEESIFMSIGHREFQIPRDLFSDPGNTPNFFSLGFAIFFSNPNEIFPGLSRQGLIRPPSILPPSVPGRSADTFAELLHLLRGYPVHIKNDEHRATLLRDCRYFNFKGLEQRLIPHAISFNQSRRREEIALRLEDILKSGISVLPDPLPQAGQPGADPAAGWVNYARPFVDEKPFELVLEIGGENMRLHFGSSLSPSSTSPTINNNTNNSAGESQPPHHTRVEFFRDARTRITKLFEVIASKLALPPTTQPLGLLMAAGKSASSQPPTPGNTPLSEEDWVKCVLEPETSIVLDGKPYAGSESSPDDDEEEEEEGDNDDDAMVLTTTHTFRPVFHVGGAHGGRPTPSPQATTTMSDIISNNPLYPPQHHHHHQQQQHQHPMTNNPTGTHDDPNATFSNLSLNNPRKRRRTDGGDDNARRQKRRALTLPTSSYWIIKTGQWRLRIRSAKHGRSNVECYLHAVKLDAMSGELARNEVRGFLKG